MLKVEKGRLLSPAENQTGQLSALDAAFSDRLLIGAKEVARLLGIDEKTLRIHLLRGDMTFRLIGTGTTRQRRRFGKDDILAFLEKQRARFPDPLAPSMNRRSKTLPDRPYPILDFSKPMPEEYRRPKKR